jgi:GNAT superfamily N-acetyltransferase
LYDSPPRDVHLLSTPLLQHVPHPADMATSTAAELTVRRATEQDVPALLALRDLAARTAYARLGDKAITHWLAARNTEAWLHQRLRHPHGVLHVATHGDSLVGCAFVRFDGQQAFLGDVFVRARHGVDGRLLDAQLDLARSWGCASAWCHAYAVDSAALRLLQAHGFSISGMTECDVVPGAVLFRHERAL